MILDFDNFKNGKSHKKWLNFSFSSARESSSSWQWRQASRCWSRFPTFWKTALRNLGKLNKDDFPDENLRRNRHQNSSSLRKVLYSPFDRPKEKSHFDITKSLSCFSFSVRSFRHLDELTLRTQFKNIDEWQTNLRIKTLFKNLSLITDSCSLILMSWYKPTLRKNCYWINSISFQKHVYY